MTEQCGSCYYLKVDYIDSEENPISGICRRLPPSLIPGTGEAQYATRIGQPIVYHDNWCGEYRLRKSS